AVLLAITDQRCDAAADIVDRRVAGELHAAGLGVDLDLAYGATVWEHRIVHLIVGHNGNAVLELPRKLVARGLLGELEKIERAVGLARAESAVAEFNMLPHTSQDRGSDFLALRNEVGQRLRAQRCGI